MADIKNLKVGDGEYVGAFTVAGFRFHGEGAAETSQIMGELAQRVEALVDEMDGVELVLPSSPLFFPIVAVTIQEPLRQLGIELEVDVASVFGGPR